jgi:hypothetical protein
MDTFLDTCPSWGYLVLLVSAVILAVVAASMGFRFVGKVAQRVRRVAPLRD